MEYILYISRFLYRIRWWLLIGTAIITFAVYYFGKRMIGKTYNVEATLYTGAASGYNLACLPVKDRSFRIQFNGRCNQQHHRR